MNTPVRLDQDSAVSIGQDLAQNFVFVLLDRFCQVGSSTFVEALSLANQYNGSAMFTWQAVSEGGAPVTSSVHLPTSVTGGLERSARNSTIVLCGGPDPKRAMSDRVLAWLRREHRRGVICGALGSGVFTLARAGLLDGRRAVVHWGSRTRSAIIFLKWRSATESSWSRAASSLRSVVPQHCTWHCT